MRRGDGSGSKIAGFEVKKEIKYLGVWIDDKRSMKTKRLRNWVSYLVGGKRRKMEMGRIISNNLEKIGCACVDAWVGCG